MYLTNDSSVEYKHLIICTKALVANLAVYVNRLHYKMSEIGPIKI